MDQKVLSLKSETKSRSFTYYADIAWMVLIFILYAAAGKLGLKLAFEHQSVSAVWVPSGIALTVFLLKNYRIWPAVFLGAFFVNFTTTGDIPSTFCIAAGNTLEGLIGAFLLNKFANGKYFFEMPRNILKFVILASVFSTAISATIGTTSLAIFGLLDWKIYPDAWVTWWIGDAVGDILITPLVILWILGPHIDWNKKKILEIISLLFILTLICFITFSPFSNIALKHLPFGFLIIPPFIWMAFRFPQKIVAALSVAVCGFAIWGTLNGYGPFVVSPFGINSQNESLLFLQSFIGIITIMSIGFSSVIVHKDRDQQFLKEALNELDERVNERTAELNAFNEALVMEINQRKSAQIEIEKKNSEVKLLQDITIAANQTYDVDSVLKYTLDRICEFTSWPIGHVYIVENNEKIIPTIIWNSGAADKYNNFKSITEKLAHTINEGLPGKIWALRKPLWVGNLNNSNLPRAKYLIDMGFKSEFGFPVITDKKVIGVLEFFSPDETEPDKNFLEIVQNIGIQLGRVVERAYSIEKLKDSASRFRAVAESANDAIITIDSSGYIIFFNKSAEIIFGYTEKEILNEPLTILMPDNQQSSFWSGFKQYKLEGKANILGKVINLIGKRKNGDEFSIELSVADWVANGKRFYTGIIRDITNRKKAEDKLISSEKQLKYAQQLAHVGSFEWNLVSERVIWSDELYRIFAVFPFEVDGSFETLISKIHPDDRKYFRDSINESFKTASSSTIEHRIVLSDGMIRHLQTHWEFTIDEKDRVSKLVGACQDITDRKEAEAKLIETQNELVHKEKLASLGRFSSAIAHEIRNPLANISALSQLVMKAEVNDKLKKHLNYIVINSEIANKIIKDLLNYASPEDLELSNENIAEVLNEAVESVMPRCTSKNIKISVDIPDNLPIMCIDKIKIENSFLNILSNSIDAMPDGGELIVNMKEDQRHNLVQIEFTDTGIGIPSEHLDKIFEPFFTTKDNGTGLGLGLTYQTIKTHGGLLDIKSEPGKGTQLIIKLPFGKN